MTKRLLGMFKALISKIMGKIILNQRSQLLVIVCAVVSIAAVISHGIIAWLKIETTFGDHWKTTPGGKSPTAFMAGSSLAGDGISWGRISEALNRGFEGWGVAGSSPSEWEQFQPKAKQTRLTILVVSPYDLNEYFLCDFRPEVVPLGQTIRDLWQSHAEWSFSKRVLSQYPLTYLRILFPTAGRSNGVMSGVFEKLKSALHSTVVKESEAGPTFSVVGEKDADEKAKQGKISNWPVDRMLRRLTAMRGACQGKHGFQGPKRQAFFRMLSYAQDQAGVVVVVLPVSPAYNDEFLTPVVRREYGEMLKVAQSSFKQMHLVRLDKLKELQSNEYFWDLVHMNASGKKIATDALVGQLREFRSTP